MSVAPVAGPPRPVAEPRSSGSATASGDDGGFAALVARSTGGTAGEAVSGTARGAPHPHRGEATDPDAPDADTSGDTGDADTAAPPDAGTAAGQPVVVLPAVTGTPPWVTPAPAAAGAPGTPGTAVPPGAPGTPGAPGATGPVVRPAALGRALAATSPTTTATSAAAPAAPVDTAPVTTTPAGTAGAAPATASMTPPVTAPVTAAAGPGPRHAGARDAASGSDGVPAVPATGTAAAPGPGGTTASTAPLTRTELVAASSGPAHAGTVTRQVFGEVVRLAETGPRHDTTQHLTLRLDPGSLGEVRVTLSMRGTSVRVRLTATGGHAREALAQGAPELRRLLGSRGDDVVVTVRDTSPSGGSSQHRDDDPGRHGRPATDHGTGPDPRSGGSSSGSHQTPDGEHPGASAGDPGRRARTPAATHAMDGTQGPATRSRPESPLQAGRSSRLDLSV